MDDKQDAQDAQELQDDTPLFRPEAVNKQLTPISGNLVIAQSASGWLLTVCLLASVIIGAVALTQLSFTEKHTVSGYLRTTEGISPLYSTQQGIVTEIFTHNGDHVVSGQPLLRLKPFDPTVGGQSLNTEKQRLIKQEIATVYARQQALKDKLQQRLKSNDIDIQRDQDSLDSLGTQQRYAKNRRLLAEKQYQNGQALHKKGALSERDLDSLESAWLDAAENETTLNVAIKSREQDILQRQLNRKQFTTDTELLLQELSTELSSLETNLLTLQAFDEITLVAAADGRVTDLSLAKGEDVPAGERLLNLLPPNPIYEAIALVPVEQARLLQPGQPVVLRYHSYPHQQFGRYHGTLRYIASNTAQPGDDPIHQEGAYFRVYITLDQQHVTQRSDMLPLRFGMTFDADIQYEKKRVIDWLFEPLYAFKGRIL